MFDDMCIEPSDCSCTYEGEIRKVSRSFSALFVPFLTFFQFVNCRCFGVRSFFSKLSLSM